LIATFIVAPVCNADDLTRWRAFDPVQEFNQCSNAPSNVARSYCYDEIDKKLRRAIKWADSYVLRLLEMKQMLADNLNSFEGRYAKEAIETLRKAAKGYSLLISSDCVATSWQMNGGSGQGLLAQACEINHRIKLFGHYKNFF
jgi:hypothetical protein